MIKIHLTVICLLFQSRFTFSFHRDDSASVLQSALETAGISFPEQPSYLLKRSPKSSIFSKYAWRFRFPFRSFGKDSNRMTFAVENPTLNALQKPLKTETDEQPDYDQMMGMYRRPRFNIQPGNPNQGPEYTLNGPLQNQLIESMTLKPLNSLEIVSPHTLYMTDSATNEPVIEDPKMAKIRSIRYDYSGFKPMGPGTSSPLVYHAYPDDNYPPPPNNQSYYPASPTSEASPSTASMLNASSAGLAEVHEHASTDGKNGEVPLDTAETFTASILFHPEKVEPDNKIILPVNPTDLLRLVAKEGRSKLSPADCSDRDLGWCNLGEHYPTHYVETIIRQCQKSVDQMYVEVPSNIPDYNNYLPFNLTRSDKMADQENNTSSTTASSSSSPAKTPKRRRNRSMCDSERKFIKPIIAQDITGNWYLIVQTSLYNQQVPVEVCSKPSLPCSKSSKCGMKTRCIQKFSTQLMISINMDKEKDCPSMKLYRFPSGCVCDLGSS